jgi:hypothetical protein
VGRSQGESQGTLLDREEGRYPVEKHEHETGLFSWQRNGDIAIFRAEKPVVELAIDLGAKRDQGAASDPLIRRSGR